MKKKFYIPGLNPISAVVGLIIAGVCITIAIRYYGFGLAW